VSKHLLPHTHFLRLFFPSCREVSHEFHCRCRINLISLLLGIRGARFNSRSILFPSPNAFRFHHSNLLPFFLSRFVAGMSTTTLVCIYRLIFVFFFSPFFCWMDTRFLSSLQRSFFIPSHFPLYRSGSPLYSRITRWIFCHSPALCPSLRTAVYREPLSSTCHRCAPPGCSMACSSLFLAGAGGLRLTRSPCAQGSSRQHLLRTPLIHAPSPIRSGFPTRSHPRHTGRRFTTRAPQSVKDHDRSRNSLRHTAAGTTPNNARQASFCVFLGAAPNGRGGARRGLCASARGEFKAQAGSP